jgi:hypothetical protein
MFNDVVARTCYWTPSEQNSVTLQVENGMYRICRLIHFNHICYNFFPHGATAPSGPGSPHCRGFTITLRHTSLGRTPLDE